MLRTTVNSYQQRLLIDVAVIGIYHARMDVTIETCATENAGAGNAILDEVVRAGQLEIDLRSGRVRRAGWEVHLTRREYQVLSLLATWPGLAVPSSRLLMEVWSAAHADRHSMLRVVVHGLRAKLEEVPAAPELIVTDPGVGYRLAC